MSSKDKKKNKEKQHDANSKPDKFEKLIKYITGSLDNPNKMENIAKQHIDSFNYAMTDVLKIIPKYIRPIQIKSSVETKSIFSKKLTITLDQLELGTPVKENQELVYKYDNNLYPADCRERQINYNAPISAILTIKFDNNLAESIRVKLGNIPIMVKSNFCNLKGKSLDELIKLKEEFHDFGGYFIINGLEKLIRMITITRRNYPIAYVRPSVTKKRAGCSEFVCEMKCVREEQYVSEF